MKKILRRATEGCIAPTFTLKSERGASKISGEHSVEVSQGIHMLRLRNMSPLEPDGHCAYKLCSDWSFVQFSRRVCWCTQLRKAWRILTLAWWRNIRNDLTRFSTLEIAMDKRCNFDRIRMTHEYIKHIRYIWIGTIHWISCTSDSCRHNNTVHGALAVLRYIRTLQSTASVLEVHNVYV